MARVSRSKATVDFSEVTAFADKLELTRRLADSMRDDWENQWGRIWADEIRARVPRGTRRSPASARYGPLHTAVRQVEAGGPSSGGVTFGNAFYWRFLEYGTSKMAPRPFIKGTMRKIRTPAKKDAAERAIRLIQSGTIR